MRPAQRRTAIRGLVLFAVVLFVLVVGAMTLWVPIRNAIFDDPCGIGTDLQSDPPPPADCVE